MELQEALNERRSDRSYTGETPTKEEVDALLKAAYEAPIGMGKYDSIHLTLVSNKELLDEIDSTAARIFGRPDGHPLYGAPLLIVVSSNQEGNVASANVAAILQNISLTAVELGLGSCYIYGALAMIAQQPDLIAKLQLPEGFKPVGSIIVGKTEQPFAPREIPEGHRFAQNVIA